MRTGTTAASCNFAQSERRRQMGTEARALRTQAEEEFLRPFQELLARLDDPDDDLVEQRNDQVMARAEAIRAGEVDGVRFEGDTLRLHDCGGSGSHGLTPEWREYATRWGQS